MKIIWVVVLLSFVFLSISGFLLEPKLYHKETRINKFLKSKIKPTDEIKVKGQYEGPDKPVTQSYSNTYGKKRVKLFFGNLKRPEFYVFSPRGYRLQLEEKEGCCLNAMLFLNINRSLGLYNFTTAEVQRNLYKLNNFWSYINVTFPVYKYTRFNFVIVFDISNKYEKLFVKRLYDITIHYGLSEADKYLIR